MSKKHKGVWTDKDNAIAKALRLSHHQEYEAIEDKFDGIYGRILQKNDEFLRFVRLELSVLQKAEMMDLYRKTDSKDTSE